MRNMQRFWTNTLLAYSSNPINSEDDKIKAQELAQKILSNLKGSGLTGNVVSMAMLTILSDLEDRRDNLLSKS